MDFTTSVLIYKIVTKYNDRYHAYLYLLSTLFFFFVVFIFIFLQYKEFYS